MEEDEIMRIAMVEDVASEAELIGGYIDRFAKENGITVQVRHFPDAVKFLSSYNSDYDVVFMDIEMPQINGMEAARKLRKTDSQVILVFITNMVQFAINGYEVGAYDFIVKPVSYVNFCMKFKRVLTKYNINSKNGEELVLPCKTGVRRVAVSSIKYVEVSGHHLLFHTFDAVVDVCGNLTKVEERLKNYNFVRCNSCYLVNLKYVTEVKGDFTTVGGEQLQISRRRRQNFIDELTLYLGDS